VAGTNPGPAGKKKRNTRGDYVWLRSTEARKDYLNRGCKERRAMGVRQVFGHLKWSWEKGIWILDAEAPVIKKKNGLNVVVKGKGKGGREGKNKKRRA